MNSNAETKMMGYYTLDGMRVPVPPAARHQHRPLLGWHKPQGVDKIRR